MSDISALIQRWQAGDERAAEALYNHLVGYIHQTLTGAEREAVEQHLAACPRCRACLADHQALQRRIHHRTRVSSGPANGSWSLSA